MSTNLITAEDATIILQNRFNKTNIKFISSELKPISENLEGFLGQHYNLYITYELNDKTDTGIFFLKTKPSSDDLRIELCNQYNAYEKEIFIYDFLIKEFDKSGYDTSFAAKSYYCIPDKTLILENLVYDGFVLSEKQAVFDLNKIKCALKALALYHAAGFAFQESMSKEDGRSIFEEYPVFKEELLFVFLTNPSHIAMKWWNITIKRLNNIIDIFPETETFKSNFKNMFNKFPLGKVFVEKTKLAKTCGHGDLWSNNMMFRYENDVPVECRLLDFQLCRYFYPCFDVLLVIFGNTSPDFRKSHLDELYQYYYTSLDNTLNNYGCSIENILPRKDFYESIRLTKVDALLQVMCSIFLLYLPQEMFNNTMKEENGEENIQDFLFNNSSICCDAFNNDARYRKYISGTMLEIRDALLALQST